MTGENTFLTETQVKILKLRNSGLTQAEIARKLGTSRANICSIEQRAKRNIKRAKETLALAEKIKAPASIMIEAGEDILDAAKRLFKAADGADLKVSLDTPGLVSEIKTQAGEKLDGRIASEKISLVLTSDGDVMIS